VVDHRLPGGATAGDAIRAIHAAAGPEVAVVLVTGDTHPQRIRDAQALGYPVLFKPVPAERLLRAVSEALRRIAV
jgi:DNA-binding NarL/FixJ family response regulator